jgi:hypothetical protein
MATAMSPFIESSVFALGDGDQFSFISRLVPDIDISSSILTLR